MADLNLDLSGIKPLLGQLGLGQAPAAPPKVDALPPPPMQPIPTSARAGFTAWSGDPLNQQTIANSLTMPGQSITPPNVPGASSPSPTPPAPLLSYNPMSQYKPLSPAQPPAQPLAAQAPLLSPSQPSMAGIRPLAPVPDQLTPAYAKLATDQGELQRQQTTGSGVSQIKNPWLRALARTGDIAASIINPNIASIIPGTTFHHDLTMAQQGQRVQSDQDSLKNIAQLSDVASQTAQRNADAAKKNQTAEDMEPFNMSPTQAAAVNQPALAGTQTTMRDFNRLLGMAGNNNASTGNNTRNNTTKSDVADANNTSKESIASDKVATQKAISDAANKTRLLVTQMHDSTSQANNQNTNDHKNTNGAGGFKVPADVTKRAALGSNVLENADAVEGIINKRPDIIGAAGGRYSNVQQMIGSDDPDIQAMGVRMHNIALASNGAHGVRSQQAIQKTEDELFNNFKAGPNAIKGALNATRGSMQTFLDDESNFASTGKRTGGAASAPAIAPPAASSGATIPAAAAAQLKEGQNHTFNNGQVWTLKGGKPVRIS